MPASFPSFALFRRWFPLSLSYDHARSVLPSRSSASSSEKAIVENAGQIERGVGNKKSSRGTTRHGLGGTEPRIPRRSIPSSWINSFLNRHKPSKGCCAGPASVPRSLDPAELCGRSCPFPFGSLCSLRHSLFLGLCLLRALLTKIGRVFSFVVNRADSCSIGTKWTSQAFKVWKKLCDRQVLPNLRTIQFLNYISCDILSILFTEKLRGTCFPGNLTSDINLSVHTITWRALLTLLRSRCGASNFRITKMYLLRRAVNATNGI